MIVVTICSEANAFATPKSNTPGLVTGPALVTANYMYRPKSVAYATTVTPTNE